MNRTVTTLTAALLLAAGLAGCSSLSDDTVASGDQTLCAAADSTVANIRLGGSVARTAAGLTRDLTKEDTEIHKVAVLLVKAPSDKSLQERLAGLIAERCDK